MLGIVPDGGVLGGGCPDRVVPPVVPALVPVDVLAVALDDYDVLHGVAVAGSFVGEGFVDGGLEGAGLAAAVGAVRGDDQFGFGVVDPGAERLSGEAAEHHRVDGADPGAGQQRDDGLGNHRQVHGHAVTLGDAEGFEGVGGLLDLLGELGVRVGAGVAGFALEVDGYPVAVAVFDVTVQRVVGGVDLAADEPLGERRCGPVQGLGEVLAPGQQLAGLLRPERGTVGVGLGVVGGGDHGMRGEFGGGGELTVLLGQVFEGIALRDLRRRGAGGLLGHGEPHHSSILAARLRRSAALPGRLHDVGRRLVTDVPQRAVPKYTLTPAPPPTCAASHAEP